MTLSALTWNADPGFDLLADATLHPAFDAKEIERLRSRRVTAVLQENDDPGTIAFRTVDKILYPNSPYGFSILGTVASNKAITRDDMMAFWKRGYVPSNSVLAVAGDVNESQLAELTPQILWQLVGPRFQDEGSCDTCSADAFRLDCGQTGRATDIFDTRKSGSQP